MAEHDDAVARLQAELAQEAGTGEIEGPSIHDRALAMVQALLPYAEVATVRQDQRSAQYRVVKAAKRLLAEAEAKGL